MRYGLGLDLLTPKPPWSPVHWGANLGGWWRSERRGALGTTLLAAGTTPPVLTLTGATTQLSPAPALRVLPVVGGALGVWTFNWFLNGVQQNVSPVLSAATFPLGTTGITLNIAAGTANTDNTWDATTFAVDNSGPVVRQFLQGTASRQLLVAANALNGHTGLRGVRARNTKLSNAGFSLGTKATYIFVATESSNNDSYLCSDSANLSAIISRFSSTTKLEWFNNTERYTLSNAPTAGAHVFGITQENGVSLRGFYDGAKVFDVVPTVALGASFTSLMNSHNTTSAWVGDLYEAVILTGLALPEAEMLRACKRLARYWGITLP